MMAVKQKDEESNSNTFVKEVIFGKWFLLREGEKKSNWSKQFSS